MKSLKLSVLLLTVLLLTQCAKSTDVKFYVLNPISTQNDSKKNNFILRIGLEEVNIPPYMTKSQFIVHITSNRVTLNEYDQWAGSLDKNIQRVVTTNLSTLLPGAIVMNFPWDSQFKPEYQLYLDISQFEVDVHGNSFLRANYIIYSGDVIQKKGTYYSHQKIPLISVDTLVHSMNDNLNHLTQAIAKSFILLERDKK